MRIDRGWYEDEALRSADWPAPGSSWPTLGWIVAEWIESRLVHGPGDVSGQPIRLTLEQLVFLAWAYRLDPDTGRRVVKQGFLSRPKGWAKSEFASWVVNAEAFGPVRFGGWDGDGKPKAQAVLDPWVRLMATEEGQVGNTFDCVKQALEEGAIATEFGLRTGNEIQMDRIVVPGGGEITVETGASRGKDGGRETFGVGDEIHLWILPRLKEMGRTVSRNMVKRRGADAWFLFTTTSFQPGEQSFAEDVWTEVEQASGGVAPFFDPATGLLFDHREAGPLSEEELDDDALVLRELAKAYGDAEWMVHPDVVMEMRRGTVAEANRYFLNAAVPGDSAYMDLKAWDAASSDALLRAGDEIALGFDGSRADDSTALVACRISDGLLWPLRVWNNDGSPGWRVDGLDVDEAVRSAFADYTVARFYADPAYWYDELARWEQAFGSKRVFEWWVGGSGPRKKVNEMLEAFRVGIEEKQIRPATQSPWAGQLRKHVGHAVEEHHSQGYGIRKPKRELKIDAAIAAGLAVEARRDHIQASQAPKTYAVGSWNY